MWQVHSHETKAQWEHSIQHLHLHAFEKEHQNHYKTDDINKSFHVVTQGYDENDKDHNWGKRFI